MSFVDLRKEFNHLISDDELQALLAYYQAGYSHKDILNAAKATHDGTNAPAASTPKVIRYTTSYAARSTVSSLSTDVVMWSGPVQPTVGGSGMGPNDIYLRTTS